jgi:signal transduction histidine kinase
MDAVGATAAGGADISDDAATTLPEAVPAAAPDAPDARDARDRSRRDRRLTAVAAGLAAGGTACCALAVWLHAWVGARADIAPLSVGDVVLGSVWPVVGALVVRARPRAATGWLLMPAALLGPYEVLAHYAAASALVADRPWPLQDAAASVGVWGFAAYFFVVPLLPLTFPDGPGPGRGWRVVVAVIVAVASVTTVARMFSPVALDVSPQLDNPLGVDAAPWLRYVTLTGAFTCLLGGAVLGTASLVLRMRRARGVRRAQLQWLMLGGVVLLGGMAAAVVTERSAGRATWADVLMAVGLLGPPAGIAVATVRHRLFDVELVLNRTLVLVGLSAAVVGVYAAAVLAVGFVVPPTSSLGLLLVAGCALLAASGRGVVQAGVDRLLFGLRSDPYAVVSHVGRHVAAASEPVDALQRLVDALRSALRLPYVAFESDDVGVVSGRPAAAGHHVVPAEVLGRRAGELHVGRRSEGERLSEEERAAVEDVAARAAALAYAASLVGDVAASRERIVLAREEERRRLRADLHDGVGPVLAGTAHQLDALARRLERQGDAESAGRARELRDRLRTTVQEVRAVVHGLRPPVLDQLGLGRALRELGAGYDTPAFSVDVPAALGPMAAAVEVAAYQIAGEAVTNAVRHSAAARVDVRCAVVDGHLLLEVRDDGRGLPSRPAAGVGLRSMAERAAEVGGRLDLAPAPGGGTTVRARLPLGAAPEALEGS